MYFFQLPRLISAKLMVAFCQFFSVYSNWACLQPRFSKPRSKSQCVRLLFPSSVFRKALSSGKTHWFVQHSHYQCKLCLFLIQTLLYFVTNCPDIHHLMFYYTVAELVWLVAKFNQGYQQGWNGSLARSRTSGIKASDRPRIDSGISSHKNGYREKNVSVLFWMVSARWNQFIYNLCCLR